MSDLPPGATASAEELDRGSPDMGGFTLSFMIPFERTDVYDELLVDDNPLGSSPNVAFTILRPGYDGQPVRAHSWRETCLLRWTAASRALTSL